MPSERPAQACHRTHDAYPVGSVIINGSFALVHKAEIVSLARHLEQQEKQEQPLHRIMGIEEKPDSVVTEESYSIEVKLIATCKARGFLAAGG